MQAATTYSRQYIDATRARVAEQLATFRRFASVATTPDAAATITAWSPVYFGSLVVGLDHAFVHRRRDPAQRDGNVLDEVRVLAASIAEHGGVLTLDEHVPYDPDRSVTGARPGALIDIDDVTFERLADAYLGSIEASYA
jgi:hypothetical protein